MEKRSLLCRVAEYHLRPHLATHLGVRLESIQGGDNHRMDGGCCMPGKVQREKTSPVKDESNVKREAIVDKKSFSTPSPGAA